MYIGKAHVGLTGLWQQFLVVGNVVHRNLQQPPGCLQFTFRAGPPHAVTANQHGFLAAAQNLYNVIKILRTGPGPGGRVRLTVKRPFVALRICRE